MLLSQIIESSIKNPNHNSYDHNKIPFEDFNLEQGERIDEVLFGKFIGYAHNDSYCYNLFLDVAPYLLNESNVTDMILAKLLKCIMLSKFKWLKTDLCHAKLKPTHRAIIEEQIKDPVYYY